MKYALAVLARGLEIVTGSCFTARVKKSRGSMSSKTCRPFFWMNDRNPKQPCFRAKRAHKPGNLDSHPNHENIIHLKNRWYVWLGLNCIYAIFNSANLFGRSLTFCNFVRNICTLNWVAWTCTFGKFCAFFLSELSITSREFTIGCRWGYFVLWSVALIRRLL